MDVRASCSVVSRSCVSFDSTPSPDGNVRLEWLGGHTYRSSWLGSTGSTRMASVRRSAMERQSSIASMPSCLRRSRLSFIARRTSGV